MYYVTVDALSMSEYFFGSTYTSEKYARQDCVVTIKGFDYQPISYGIKIDSNRYNNFLLSKEDYEDDEFNIPYSSRDIFDYDEILTFEFYTEEEAMYFQLKYVK